MRVRSALLVLLLGMSLVTACARVPTRQLQREGPPGRGNTVATIRILNLGSGPALDGLIAAYYAKFPQDRIEKVQVGRLVGSATAEMVRDALTQNKVDIVVTSSTEELIKAGLLLPLDPYIQRSGFDLKSQGPSLDQLRFDGRIYELPYAVQPDVLLYNRTMFRKAGLPPPRAGWTWDEFRAAAQRLTEGTGANRTWGFSPGLPESALYLYLGPWGNSLAEAFAYEPAVRGALELFGTMVWVDGTMPRGDRSSPSSPATLRLREEFQNGKAAMTVVNLGSLAYLLSGSLDIDVAPTPVSPGTTARTLATPQSMAIAAGTDQAEAAWRFIHFASGPEGAVAVARSGLVPLYRSAEVRTAWFDRQPPPPPGTEALFGATWLFPLRTGQTLSPEADQQLRAAVQTAFRQTISGERSWEEAFRYYQQKRSELAVSSGR
jgi:multiple sugar transport system substrate-binding protein